MLRLAALSALALLALPAAAQTGTVTTQGLSDAQKAEIANGTTEQSGAAARAGMLDAGGTDEDILPGTIAPDRRVHGEIGMMIGSHGTRGAYGTASVPVGDHAQATVSFEKSRYGYPY